MKKLFLILISLTVLSPAFAAEKKLNIDEANVQYAEPKKTTIKPKKKEEAKKSAKKVLDSTSYKIVALVNGDIISSEDILNRMNAFSMTTNIPLNPQTEAMIFQRVLHNAIDEKLKLQEAAKNGIVITEKEIDEAIRSFEKGNGIPEFGTLPLLTQHNVTEETFRSQIKSDLSWVKLIRNKVKAEGDITQKEIETALKEAQRDLSIKKFMISEIFIRGEDAKELHLLVENLRGDPRFELYAMQFSQSPSSSSGGKLGWVDREKLLPQLDAVLSKMKEGEVSDPINVNGDFYILKLNKIFDPNKDETPVLSEIEIRNFLENKKMEDIANQTLQNLRQKAIIELRV